MRAMTRHSDVGHTGVYWSQGDLLTDTGVDAAVGGVEVIVRCATQGTRDKDVTSAQNLIMAARRPASRTSSTCRSSASTGFRCRTTRPSCAARRVCRHRTRRAGRRIGGPAVHTCRAGTHVPRCPRRPSARRSGAAAGAHRRRLPGWCESGPGQRGRHHRLRGIPRRDQIKFAYLAASPGSVRAQFGQPPCMCQRSS